ncbi:hypothetical protein L6Q96_12485 [Candidatus Binatia bacterium]|nr:hypothetical protein [Candidatus Binatia bacterium]
MTPPAGFEARRAGSAEWWRRPGDSQWIDTLLQVVAAVPEAEAELLSGGRGGARLTGSGTHRIVIRPYRRGGLPGRIVHDLYFGWQPRPFRELVETEALRARGAPVVEVCGAVVHWAFPVLYRGWLATRYVDGARTLWQLMSAAPAPADRMAACAAAGRAIRRLHDCGGRHPDLNLNNLLVSGTDADWQVHLIDFDRPAVRVGRDDPMVELARLRRSAAKLDPAAQFVTPADLACLEAAYRRGESR